jgi:type II secretory pathway pseudopilin PulG
VKDLSPTACRASRRSVRRGFTLVEALASTAVTVIAGSAILLSLATSLQSTEEAWQQATAGSIAQQIIDEIAGLRYAAPGAGPRQWPLGPEGNEGPQRASFNDIDDPQGFTSAPVDSWGKPLGQGNGQGGLRPAAFRLRDNYFKNWRTTVDVFYVNDSNLAQAMPLGHTSFHRGVRVGVYLDQPGRTSKKLGEVQRVFSYVPEP